MSGVLPLELGHVVMNLHPMPGRSGGEAHAFLPYVVGENVQLAIYQGVGLPVRVPSELLEAWVQAEWC